MSTENVEDSIGNIPFLGVPNPAQATDPINANAFVYSASATFWIEWVAIDPPDPRASYSAPTVPAVPDPDPAHQAIEPFSDKPNYLQLQYSQEVILIFNKVLWPHITVATLTLSAG